MNLQVKGRNLEVSDQIRQYAEDKLGKLERLVNDPTRVELELAVEKNPSIADNQIAEATFHLKGVTLRAHECSPTMTHSVHELAEDLRRQVKKHRELRRARRRTRKIVGKLRGRPAEA